jgi:chemotaxis protein CheC
MVDKMENEEILNLNEFQRDALKEVANIGMGNSITSLSKLINRKVNIHVPDLKIEKIEDVPEIVGSPEEPVVGTIVGLRGNFMGYIAIIFPEESAEKISQIVMDSDDVDLQSEMTLSMMGEVGQILAGSYSSAISDFFGINTSITIPYTNYDMVAAIMDNLLIEMSIEVDYAIVFDTEFTIKDEHKVRGSFLTMFDKSLLDDFLERINKMV